MTISKFSFYEVVRILGEEPLTAPLAGHEGVVLGMTEDTEGNWSYAVTIEETTATWPFREDELETTGLFRKPEDFLQNALFPVSGEDAFGMNLLPVPPVMGRCHAGQ